MKPPQYYSRLAHTSATQGGNLPHWSQRCATFTTFRLADSLPDGKLEQMRVERDEWLLAHCGRDVPSASYLSAADLAEYRELFSKRFHEWLDAGHGSCILRNVAARSVVEDAFRHFADVRYSLYSFVVMPNHVHVLFMPEEKFDSREIVTSWKRFTSHAVNRVLGRNGTLWQKESYDHLVRDADEFNAYRAYIRHNDPQLAFDAYSMWTR